MSKATPSVMASCLRIKPVVFQSGEGWGGITLQRFQNLPSTINLPGMADELLVCHMRGPLLAEANLGTTQFERQWINPGHLGIVPAGEPVHRNLKGTADVVLVHLPHALLRQVSEATSGSCSAQIQLHPMLAAHDAVAVQLIQLMLAEAQTPTDSTPLMVQSLSQALIVHILRRYSSAHASAQDSISLNAGGGRVGRLIELMHRHLDETITLDRLAATLGLSPNRVTRLFKVATGLPPHQFLVRLRLEKACELLESTQWSVLEIALRCGFDQPSHFASSFRRLKGMSPREWRLERQFS